jgi:hypothetical protein
MRGLFLSRQDCSLPPSSSTYTGSWLVAQAAHQSGCTLGNRCAVQHHMARCCRAVDMQRWGNIALAGWVGGCCLLAVAANRSQHSGAVRLTA